MSLYRPIEFRDGGTPVTGLAPSVDACYRVSDKVAVAPLPTVDEIGNGAYRIIHNADVPWIALIDSNDAGMSDQDRYKWVLLTANDFGMDTLVTRVPGEVAQKAHFVDGSGDITPPTNTGLWDRLDATVGSRAFEAGGNLADVKAKTDNLPANTSTELDAIDSALTTIDDFVDDLETRLTATRAGYLDNLSVGAVAQEATLTAIKGVGWTDETLKAIYDALASSGITINQVIQSLWSKAVIDKDAGTYTVYGLDGVTVVAQGEIISTASLETREPA